MKFTVLFCRIALFVIYFWFGLLKVLGQSPASPLVQALFDKTIPLMSFGLFFTLFGLFEMLIGILFLIPKAEKIAVTLFFIHIFATTLPLFVLRGMTFTAFFVPTLEGQYIVKNLALIACALTVLQFRNDKAFLARS